MKVELSNFHRCRGRHVTDGHHACGKVQTMFKVRLASGVVLVALALITILTGGWLLFGTMLTVSLIGMFELYRAVGVMEKEKPYLACAGFLGVIAYYIAVGSGGDAYLLSVLTGALILVMCVYVFTFPRYLSGQVMATFFGIVYVGVMLCCIYQTRMLEGGSFTVWLIFLSAWGCDTCAYCAGRLFGKHKMAPVLSPKKSVEGAIGGVIGAAILGGIYAYAIRGSFGRAPIWEYALICCIGALISMVGDLAASAIKRNHEIKDYGHLIPGHGGILDRFDSVIFTAPVIYLLARVLL